MNSISSRGCVSDNIHPTTTTTMYTGLQQCIPECIQMDNHLRSSYLLSPNVCSFRGGYSSVLFVLNSLVLSQPDGRRDLCLITHHLYFIIYYLSLCLRWAFHRSPTFVPLHLASFRLILSSACHSVLFFTFDCLISLIVTSPFPPGTHDRY